MKANELLGKSAAELATLKTTLLQEQFNLRMQKATGQLVKPDLIQKVRRNIARVNTVISQLANAEGVRS
jgi:large subunit ribosomal protein L29